MQLFALKYCGERGRDVQHPKHQEVVVVPGFLFELRSTDRMVPICLVVETHEQLANGGDERAVLPRPLLIDRRQVAPTTTIDGLANRARGRERTAARAHSKEASKVCQGILTFGSVIAGQSRILSATCRSIEMVKTSRPKNLKIIARCRIRRLNRIDRECLIGFVATCSRVPLPGWSWWRTGSILRAGVTSAMRHGVPLAFSNSSTWSTAADADKHLIGPLFEPHDLLDDHAARACVATVDRAECSATGLLSKSAVPSTRMVSRICPLRTEYGVVAVLLMSRDQVHHVARSRR